MQHFDNLRIIGVQVTEIRATTLSSTPDCVAKFSYVLDTHQTAGLMVTKMFSARTQRILRDLQASMELDVVALLSSGGEVPDEQDPEPGPSDDRGWNLG